MTHKKNNQRKKNTSRFKNVNKGRSQHKAQVYINSIKKYITTKNYGGKYATVESDVRCREDVLNSQKAGTYQMFRKMSKSPCFSSTVRMQERPSRASPYHAAGPRRTELDA